MKAAWAAGFLLLTLCGAVFVFASEPVAIKIRDLTSVEGVRENPLIGYGEISDAINREFGHAVASARDGGRVEVDPAATGVANLTAVLARIENLAVPVHRRARVVLSERTGTIVMGKDVRLGAVSILHGGFSVQIQTEYSVSQPAPLSP